MIRRIGYSWWGEKVRKLKRRIRFLLGFYEVVGSKGGNTYYAYGRGLKPSAWIGVQSHDALPFAFWEVPHHEPRWVWRAHYLVRRYWVFQRQQDADRRAKEVGTK